MSGKKTRPKFDALWVLFKKVQGDGTVDFVGNFLGGKVAQNIAAGSFENACALRMSYALNFSGYDVANSGGKTVSGADRRHYIYRVKDMRDFLFEKFGQPDLVAENPKQKDFEGKRGIILFAVKIWRNATGHVTLWDGKAGMDCSDSCYFTESVQASLWVLP
jgi:hypothetical protein